MSLKGDARDRIRTYLMDEIFLHKEKVVQHAAEAFHISKQSVYKHLDWLIKEGKVRKIKNTEYELVRTVSESFIYDLNQKPLYEDKIFEHVLLNYIAVYNENTKHIWAYAFTEMVNNVIDHSGADKLDISIAQNALYTWVKIQDNGIGIFNKICNYYNYSDIEDAVAGLFKGKLTTDSENHSGEGIFFTSKVMDHFFVISSNKMFSQNNTRDNLIDIKQYEGSTLDKYADQEGTIVVMSLTNNVDRSLREVFDMYSSVDGGFTITKIPMKQVCDGGYPVSRSQAKRLYIGFEKFEKVIMDFAGVKDIGQGFAHELFVVFKKKHPDIELECINTNDDVDRMIRHVQES